MKNKSITFFVLFAYIISIFSVRVCAAENIDISIIIAEENFGFYYLDCDISPVLKGGNTLVPLRAIAEKFQFNVEWDNYEQSVIVSKEDKQLKLWIGKREAIANGKTVQLPATPEILSGKTIVPIRYICEFLEINVLWEQHGNKAFIWLSTFELLNEKDVEPDDNYYQVWEDIPYYMLNDDGITSRGIKIGDEYAKVIEQYGTPHKFSNDAKISIEYYTPFLPNSSSGSLLIFNFENEKLTSVEIDY